MTEEKRWMKYRRTGQRRPGDEEIIEPAVVPDGFAEIPGYEGLYAVSQEGVVVSLGQALTGYHVRRKREPRKGKELAAKKHRTGAMVKLSHDNDQKDWYVHQLVYMAWGEGAELPAGARIKHCDGDIYNNAYHNLQLRVKEKTPPTAPSP